MGVVASAVRILLVFGIEEVVAREEEAQGLAILQRLRQLDFGAPYPVGGRCVSDVDSGVEACLASDEEVIERDLTREAPAELRAPAEVLTEVEGGDVGEELARATLVGPYHEALHPVLDILREAVRRVDVEATEEGIALLIGEEGIFARERRVHRMRRRIEDIAVDPLQIAVGAHV